MQDCSLKFISASWKSGFVSGLYTVCGIVFLIFALISFMLGLGLWALKPWARMLALIFAVIGIIFAIGSFGLLSLLINVIIVYYLTRPGVKDAFSEKVQDTQPNTIMNIIKKLSGAIDDAVDKIIPSKQPTP